MQIKANTPDDYIKQIPEAKKEAIKKLRQTILNNLPKGFEETVNYGMIGYVVPHSVYPKGYHADPKQPLPFIHIAAQKNHIALYHSGLYAKKDLLNWFKNEYPNHTNVRLDMGKSCIRFKNAEQIPYRLIGELVSKMKPEEWIRIYESSMKK